MLLIETYSDLIEVVLVHHPLQYLGAPDHLPLVQFRKILLVSLKIFLPRFPLHHLLHPILLLRKLFRLLVGNISKKSTVACGLMSYIKCDVM